MATVKRAKSMDAEDRAFAMAAYKSDPKAKAAMDADMKKKGVTRSEYFGTARKTAAKKK